MCIDNFPRPILSPAVFGKDDQSSYSSLISLRTIPPLLPRAFDDIADCSVDLIPSPTIVNLDYDNEITLL